MDVLFFFNLDFEVKYKVMRKRNKTLGKWKEQLIKRINSQFDEWFGEPNYYGKYPIILDVSKAPFPKDKLNVKKISWKEFENTILPVAYEDDIGDVYLDLLNEVKKRFFDTHKDRFAVITTLRKFGTTVEDYILEYLYSSTQIYIELGDLLKTLDIEIIPEFEDVHIKTKLVNDEPFNKEVVDDCYSKATKRFIDVWNKREDCKPVYIRPIKGNRKERLIVNFDRITEEFEMYYSKFPNYCCTCFVACDEKPELALKEYAKVFTMSVYKHYWPEVVDYLKDK